MRHLFIIVVLACLSLCCGGGGGSSSTSSGDTEGADYRIEFVYPPEVVQSKPTYLTKAANLTTSIFRIGTDQNEGLGFNEDGEILDPIQATGARATFSDNNGRILATATTDLPRILEERTSGNFIVLDESSREITFRGVPENIPLQLDIVVGRDLGEFDQPFGESIFYSGSLSNIMLNGSTATVEGNVTDVLAVELRTVIGDELYNMQLYVDYSTMPIVSPLVPSDNAVTSITMEPNPFTDDAEAGISPLEQIEDSIFDQQAYFFEALGVPRSQTEFDVNIDAGANLNFLLGGVITEADALSGVPLLIDYQTTYQRILAKWHDNDLVGYERGVAGVVKGSGNLGGVYTEMEKAFDRVSPLIYNTPSSNMITSGNVDGNGSLEYYPIQAHDLGLLQWAFYIARHCNNPSEDPVESPFKFRFTNINKFVGEVIDIDMISRVSATMDQSLGAFLFNDEKSFPIQINFDYEENADVLKTPLYIASGMGDNPPVDAFGNLITDANTMTSAGNLRDIFLERVAEPYYSSNVLWNYIDQISDLELVLPNDG